MTEFIFHVGFYGNYMDDYCLALLLKGVCQKFRGQFLQAEQCFLEVIDRYVHLLHLCHPPEGEGDILFSVQIPLTLVLLNLDMPCICKQCHSTCEFISTIWIKVSDWLTIKVGVAS